MFLPYVVYRIRRCNPKFCFSASSPKKKKKKKKSPFRSTWSLSIQVIGWIVGFFLQSFKYTFYIIAAGAVLSVIVAVPAWPMYRQNPLKWLPNLPKEDATVATKSPEAGKKKESKKQR
eukprot:TRINITY_DN1918_c0_g1_i2.p1 TRINITY_DN1918_c0_g1~~TRINITY_DN1918_c0_g1_i2.p1  ORF type:complete len:118 (-),score=16.46 TRINITY_DN1918_c0_g1_i2:96-449(-)